MAGSLFLLSKVKANAQLGYKHIRASGSKYKKMIVGSTAVLTLFAVPFAAQAAIGSLGQTGSSDASSSQPQAQPEQSKTEDNSQIKGQSTNNVDIKTNASSSSNGDGEVDVTVNGEEVPVPPNGRVHKTIGDNNNRTVVDIQIDNDSSSTNSYSSTTINVDSSSNTDDTTRHNRPVRR